MKDRKERVVLKLIDDTKRSLNSCSAGWAEQGKTEDF